MAVPSWVKVGFLRTLRVLNLGIAVLFLISAILQYNDGINGIWWALIYLTAGVLSVLAEFDYRNARNYVWRPLVIVFTLACFCGSWYYFANGGDVFPSDAGFNFSGLLLVSLWMVFVLILEKSKVIGIGFKRIPQNDEEAPGANPRTI
jgi:hypothetical protein